MHLTLASLLGLLSTTTALPSRIISRDANPGCQAASLGDFAWAVEAFDYHASYIFTTPAHQNSWGYATFTLSNPALTYKGECSAASSQLSDFFYGTIPYSCVFPEGSSAHGEFNYNRPSGLLNITQTWTCSDEDSTYPTTFGAKGSVVLDLQCTDTTWQNPDWTSGQIYSDREVKCTPIDVTVPPYERTAVA